MRFVAGRVIPWGNPSSTTLYDMATSGAAIVNSNDTTALGSPLTRLREIDFDSWHFDYWSCRYRATATLNMPARSPDISTSQGKYSSTAVYASSGSTEYVISNIDFGYMPIVMGYSPTTGKALNASAMYSNGDSARTLSLVASATGIVVSESFVVGYSGLPAISLDVIVLVMDQGMTVSSPNTYPYQLAALGDRVIIGGGKIDTERSYAFVDAAGCKFNTTPSIELSVTQNVNTQGATTAARARSFENGALQSEISCIFGNWTTGLGAEWPNMLCDGKTIGISL